MAIHTWDGFTPAPPACQGAVVTLGNFDGVHLGHQQLVFVAHQLARSQGSKAIAITFDPPPMAILRPEISLRPLSSLTDRSQWLANAGADEVLVLATSPQLLNLEAATFFHEVLRNRLRIVGLVEGHNFAFGKERTGTLDVLAALCDGAHLPLKIVPPVAAAGEPVSSSRVRQAIRAGDVAEVRLCLGRPYAIRGRVKKGEARGRTLGFPTANLEAITTLLPAEGVYAVNAMVDRQTHYAVMNLGPNPTFGGAERKVEVHLLDFAGDLYEQHLSVEFFARLRAIRVFPSADELKRQLTDDVAAARRLFGEANARVDSGG